MKTLLLIAASLACFSGMAAAEEYAAPAAGGMQIAASTVTLTVPLELDPIPSGMTAESGVEIANYVLACTLFSDDRRNVANRYIALSHTATSQTVLFDDLTDVQLGRVVSYKCKVYLGHGLAMVTLPNLSEQSRAMIVSDDEESYSGGTFE